jgi:hypothetical protein
VLKPFFALLEVVLEVRELAVGFFELGSIQEHSAI